MKTEIKYGKSDFIVCRKDDENLDHDLQEKILNGYMFPEVGMTEQYRRIGKYYCMVASVKCCSECPIAIGNDRDCRNNKFDK